MATLPTTKGGSAHQDKILPIKNSTDSCLMSPIGRNRFLQLRSLQELALVSTNFNYSSAAYRVTVITLDIANYWLLRPMRSDVPAEKPKQFMKIKFLKKAVDTINLPALLRSTSITDKIPVYFRDKENTQDKKLNFCWQLIGEQVISLERFSFRLVDGLHDENETVAQKCKRQVISKMCQISRDMGFIFNKLETNQS